MKYLISGMPRCRTAWLTAVLRAHGSRAYHDIYARNITLYGAYGVVDPAVALYTPKEGIAAANGHPSLCVVSNSLTERLDALADATNVAFTKGMRRIWAENYAHFADNVPNVHVDFLDDDAVVGEIVRHCTKQAPSIDIIQTFQLLHIEERMSKATEIINRGAQKSQEFMNTLTRMRS